MVDIDFVYLWVDGNDPKWIAKRNACIGEPSKDEKNCKGRYVSNDELKYSLRSVEKYAPWIRKIFIVTDNQVPEWLDTTHPKIQIVDHTEILPAEYLPVTPNTFFAKDLLPIIRFNRRPFRKWYLLFKTKVEGKQLRNYLQTIHNAALLVEKKYGTYYSGKTHHNIDAYLKSNYEHTRQVFDKEISATLTNHVRSMNDIQRNIYSYVPLAEKRAHMQYVTQRTSFRFHIDNRKLYRKFEKYNPMLFCMNDSQFANDDDRKCAIAFLGKLFPDKSQFEK